MKKLKEIFEELTVEEKITVKKVKTKIKKSICDVKQSRHNWKQPIKDITIEMSILWIEVEPTVHL